MSLAMTTAPAFASAQARQFVEEWSQHCRPDHVVWCTGDPEEDLLLRRQMVASGMLKQLDHSLWPNSYLALSDPDDVARVEDRTYICSNSKDDAGPINNWVAPDQMKMQMREKFAGCMQGRTMYVIAYCMGPLGSALSSFGVMVTDSPYVVVNMRIMTRMGDEVLRAFGPHTGFVRGVHSVGAPLEAGQQDVRWPCDTKNITISHFTDEGQIWSYGSGYGGNALLGKKCHALRIASAKARKQGWLAEHMFVSKVTSPQGEVHYIAGAFPSACGKTNLAMMQPTLPGWEVETLGDDIAWMRQGHDGRLYAVNPEAGLFGVVPNTNVTSNPRLIDAMKQGNVIFTNVAYTEAGDIWWEGIGHKPPPSLRDWRGQPWQQGQATPAAHPNSRATIPITNLASADLDRWNDPAGVPISAILYGGRRPSVVPLVRQARTWLEGIFGAATLASETTAAAAGKTGRLRFDPSAMKPFFGYNVGEYYRHWLELGQSTESTKALPEIFFVNWFRKGADGQFLWPGFGENLRVLEWIFDRLEGRVAARSTPIGLLPDPADLNVQGLNLAPEALDELTSFDQAAWTEELSRYGEHLESLGDRLPVEVHQWLAQTQCAVANGH